jgi:glycosyltransferase involved in cell wall biosynthesis
MEEMFSTKKHVLKWDSSIEVSGDNRAMPSKRVLIIGSQPERMTRLRRSFASLKKLGVDVRILSPYRDPRGQPRILKGIIRYLILTLQIALSKADIYHFFNVPDIPGISLAWKRGVFVYDVRSPWFSSIKESLGNNVLSRIAQVVEYLLTKAADFVITANYPMAERAKRWGASKVVMVPNYPPSDFGPKRDRETVRTTLGLHDEPTVLYLGKISKIEGSALLSKIMLEVSQSMPTVRFLIVGDGPERNSVERFIKCNNLSQNVKMLGWTPHDEVADYIGAVDLCLLPRKWDSFSPYTAPENITKAAEYLAVGKPIIAPRMGGFKDATFPVISVDPEDMGKAVIEYLNNPRTLGDFVRPSWDISHKRLEKIYKHLGAI